jgi:hypothetical protein
MVSPRSPLSFPPPGPPEAAAAPPPVRAAPVETHPLADLSLARAQSSVPKRESSFAKSRPSPARTRAE